MLENLYGSISLRYSSVVLTKEFHTHIIVSNMVPALVLVSALVDEELQEAGGCRAHCQHSDGDATCQVWHKEALQSAWRNLSSR